MSAGLCLTQYLLLQTCFVCLTHGCICRPPVRQVRKRILFPKRKSSGLKRMPLSSIQFGNNFERHSDSGLPTCSAQGASFTHLGGQRAPTAMPCSLTRRHRGMHAQTTWWHISTNSPSTNYILTLHCARRKTSGCPP